MNIPKTVTSFVIKRSEWLRGEGGSASKLLRSTDKKRCCVGIYARALGVPDLAICELSWPLLAQHSNHWYTNGTEAEWLNSGSEGKLAVINDIEIPPNPRTMCDTSISISSEQDRETAIARIFWRHGITVTFED